MATKWNKYRHIFSVVLISLALTGCKTCTRKSRKVTVKRDDNILQFIVGKNSDGKVTYFIRGTDPRGDRVEREGTESLKDVFGPGEISSVPFQPAAAAIAPEATFFGVGQGKIAQLDAATAATLRTLSVGQELVDGVAGPNNDFLYAASLGPLGSSSITPSIVIVNGTTFTSAGSIPLPAGTEPTNLDVTPDGKFLYVAAKATTGSTVYCSIVDLTSNTVVKTLEFPGVSLTRPEVVVSPDGVLAFVTVNGVAVIDTLTQTVSHTLTEAVGRHIVVDPSSTRLYSAPIRLRVPNPNPPPTANFIDGVSVFDLQTSTLSRHIPVEQLGATEFTMQLALDGANLFIHRLTRNAQNLIVPQLLNLDTESGTVTQFTPESPGGTIGPILVVPNMEVAR